jgi:hypothetical protein
MSNALVSAWLLRPYCPAPIMIVYGSLMIGGHASAANDE